MKCSFFKSLLTQLKRSICLLPAAIVATVFLCTAIGIFSFCVLKTDSESEEKSMLRVAYVGDVSEYMGININSVINLVSEQFGVSLEKMTEEEARTEMLLGHLTTYIIFPDGFVESVDKGDNDKKIRYVTSEGEKGISGIILSESVDSVSELMTSSQSSFYAAFDFLKAAGRRDLYYDAGTELEASMAKAIIGVINAADVKTVGVSNGLTFTGYYLCAAILIFISLSGIGAVAFFTNRSREYQRIIRRSGQNEFKQVAAEFLSFLLIQFVCCIIIFVVLRICIGKGILNVHELGKNPVKAFDRFAMKVVPVAVTLYAMQFLVYELMESTLSAIISQFIVAVALGYISGYYYPMDFLPEELTSVTRYLPTGVAFLDISGELSNHADLLEKLMLFMYFAAFITLAVLLRCLRMHRDR